MHFDHHWNTASVHVDQSGDRVIRFQYCSHVQQSVHGPALNAVLNCSTCGSIDQLWFGLKQHLYCRWYRRLYRSMPTRQLKCKNPLLALYSPAPQVSGPCEYIPGDAHPLSRWCVIGTPSPGRTHVTIAALCRLGRQAPCAQGQQDLKACKHRTSSEAEVCAASPCAPDATSAQQASWKSSPPPLLHSSSSCTRPRQAPALCTAAWAPPLISALHALENARSGGRHTPHSLTFFINPDSGQSVQHGTARRSALQESEL